MLEKRCTVLDFCVMLGSSTRNWSLGMVKRITPSKSAAAKRAAYRDQRQQFAAGKGKQYGATISEKRQVRRIRDEFASMGIDGSGHICGHWIAI